MNNLGVIRKRVEYEITLMNKEGKKSSTSLIFDYDEEDQSWFFNPTSSSWFYLCEITAIAKILKKLNEEN